ncbi:molybdopterin-dependent oxidoreductase [Labrenzia sp. OB1]|uniref:molybdopterin-dependent oxidoreductase n=1 Tax=Labrenzia sp. OB1 TaxID=1561204 RepID=UPI0007B22A67|nr:molybdopterin-dependent oxidoreductase [Labrenzia sp. OB1]KZM49089.1 hypothetical protein OA90_16630 [Labrenzia sp. OB1]
MELFASHFGTYEIERGPEGPGLLPFRHDPAPSPIGQGFLALADHPTRITQPHARKGWLAGDRGAARGADSFVPVSLDEACALAAGELTRIRGSYGNDAIFGGSYGWGSAGRFHHPQSQLKRFLNLAGGFVAARNTYSYGTAKVLLPHMVGAAFSDPGTLNPSWDRIVEATPLILSFGGMRLANAQVEAGGTGAHMTRHWIERFAQANGEMVTLSPDRRDAPIGTHLPIRAGTDVFALLAMAYVLIEENRVDPQAIGCIAQGYDAVKSLILGDSDGQPKTPHWAAEQTGIPAHVLRKLAYRLVDGPCLINLSWSLQRAVAGEQPYWAALVLAVLSGQIGRPGCGIACGLSSVSSVGNPVRRLRGVALPQGENRVSAFIPVARITEMLEKPGQQFVYDGAELDLPDIKLVCWAGGNPFHHHQDLNRLARAWRNPHSVIVHDSVWTATAQHADLVFPSALPFEREDIAAASRDDWIVLSSQVTPPPPGIETDHTILTRIAGHLGLADAFTASRTQAQWIAHLYEGYRTAHPELPVWEEFRDIGYARISEVQPCEIPQPLEAFVANPHECPLSTPGGKIDLFPPLFQRQDQLLKSPLCSPRRSDAGEPERYPLQLLSPQPETRLHSQLDGAPAATRARRNDCEEARAHPDDISAQGLADGDVVELYNDRGAVLVCLKADPRVAIGHVVLPTGGWYRPQVQSDGRILDLGGNPNSLTRDHSASELSQGASAGGARIALRTHLR